MDIVFFIVVAFLVFMVAVGISVEMQKSRNKQEMQDMLYGMTKTPAAVPGRVGSVQNDANSTQKELDELKRKRDEASELAEKTRQEQLDLLRDMGDNWTEELSERFDELAKKGDAEFAESTKLGDQYMKALLGDIAVELSTNTTPTIPTNTGNFSQTDHYISSHSARGIAHDSAGKKFALLTTYSREIIDYSQIVGSEVVVDSETIIKTNTTSQVERALIGGLLTGGVGALVLAMGAKKKHVDNINRVELKVLTSNTSAPIHTICFFEKNAWGSAKAAVAEAQKWHDLISIAAKESSNTMRSAATREGTVPSLADEIVKLAELRDKGLLTEQEYTTAKSGLLG